ncbi:response regulator transcription factor [Novispirillum sp. DQ9]|uniref:response regulator transcription factor n=1 Tax=Novispirillum sp. DQ9 TaxID=3398612 RepID=UPI003C7BC61A
MIHPPTIFIVDDDEAMRHSLEFLLATLGQPVRAFPSAEAFLAAWTRDQPGCLVLDVRMPGMSGLQLQQALGDKAAPLAVVFISGHGDIPMVVRAMRAGALVFLEKPFNDQALLDHVAEGLRQAGDLAGKAARTAAIAGRIASLTGREAEVMRLVAEGKANKAIAFDLDISVKTVEVHRARVLEKMGVASAAELARLLLEDGRS